MANAAAGGGRSELPEVCNVCHARPGLVVVEVNGVAIERSVLCSACFSRHVREGRRSRVTPILGVPLGPPPEPQR